MEGKIRNPIDPDTQTTNFPSFHMLIIHLKCYTLLLPTSTPWRAAHISFTSIQQYIIFQRKIPSHLIQSHTKESGKHCITLAKFIQWKDLQFNATQFPEVLKQSKGVEGRNTNGQKTGSSPLSTSGRHQEWKKMVVHFSLLNLGDLILNELLLLSIALCNRW